MKTLKEIKEEVARDDNFNNWQILFESCAMYDYGRLENAIKEVTKRYATEYARESLRVASENLIEWPYEKHCDFITAKQSILSEDNLPKHR